MCKAYYGRSFVHNRTDERVKPCKTGGRYDSSVVGNNSRKTIFQFTLQFHYSQITESEFMSSIGHGMLQIRGEYKHS